jgi:hypothetical protein
MPHGDVEVVLAHLDRGRTHQPRPEQMLEPLTAKIEAGLGEQRVGSSPSKKRGSIGLIRGDPSGRMVPSMQRFPVAACRRPKISAIRGAAWLNSDQLVTGSA